MHVCHTVPTQTSLSISLSLYVTLSLSLSLSLSAHKLTRTVFLENSPFSLFHMIFCLHKNIQHSKNSYIRSDVIGPSPFNIATAIEGLIADAFLRGKVILLVGLTYLHQQLVGL